MSVPDYMRQRERPIGVSILSVLHFISALGFFGVAVFALLWLRDPKIVEKMAASGFPVPLFIAAMVVSAILAFATTVGMWSGAPWGWYLGSFWYAYSIVVNVSALFSINGVIHSFRQDHPRFVAPGIGFYYARFTIGLVLGVLLYLYFFKDNVRDYFGLLESKKWIAVAIQFFLAIDIVFAIFAWYKFAR